MGFGKPGSWVALIVFVICWIWSIIGLGISATYGFTTSGGYGLGVTGGVLGFLAFPLTGLWLCWTTLNDISILWIVLLVVICVACLFLLIAGIIFATVAWGTPAALDIVAAVTIGVGIFFWIRSRGAVPDVGVSSEGADSGQYQEW